MNSERGTIPASKRVRVHIDVARVRENLSKADGRAWTDREVELWLHDAKFTRDGDAWIVRAADLGQLEPGEVTKLEDADNAKS